MMTDRQLGVLLAHLVVRLEAALASAERALPDSVRAETKPLFGPSRSYVPALEELHDITRELRDDVKLLRQERAS